MRILMKLFYKILISVVLILSAFVSADVRLPSIFSDNMVLQQNTSVPIWGEAYPGEIVKVKASWGVSNSIKTNKKGKWYTELKTPEAGGPYKLKINASNQVLIENVLIGEVWLCSGQSNMFMPVGKYGKPYGGVESADEILSKPEQPMIRLFSDDNNKIWKKRRWQPARSDTIKDFSAVAYFFADSLYEELNIPVGVINISRGGSAIQLWTPREYALRNPFTRYYYQFYKNNRHKINAYKKELRELQAERKNNKKSVQFPEKLPHDLIIAKQFEKTSRLYNSLITPVLPYAIKGVLWYQGEANGKFEETAPYYGSMLKDLIKGWRASWKQEKMPWYIVQLPCWKSPIARNWPWVRQGQLWAAENISDVDIATICDFGDVNNLHPPQKCRVGQRLACLALVNTYGILITDSGPKVKSLYRSENVLKLKLDNCGSPIKLKGNQWKDLEIAGRDGKFYPAKATLKGNTAFISCDQVDEPLAVRYGWEGVFEPSLFNEAGLPAPSFAIKLEHKGKYSFIKKSFNASQKIK